MTDESYCQDAALGLYDASEARRCQKPGTVQHQMFHQLLLFSSTKLKRFGVGAAEKDVATSNFKH